MKNLNKRIYKVGSFFVVSFLLIGCLAKHEHSELDDYAISMTKSSQIGDEVYFQNVTFDFETRTTVDSDVLIRNSQYPLIVYDDAYHRYLYSAKDETGYDDHIYIYDIEKDEEIHIDLGIWGINYILVRNQDYIVVGVKNKTREFGLYSINKDTLNFHEIEIKHDELSDLSVWQVAYIPQTDGLLVQAYSVSEQEEYTEKWNRDIHDASVDLNIPFYHFMIDEEGVHDLFDVEIPQALGLLSNGKQVLVAVRTVNRYNRYVLRYDIETKVLEKEAFEQNLDSGFYLDNTGRYIYCIGDKIHKYDTSTGEDIILDMNFPNDGYISNFTLIKKNIDNE